MAVSGLLLIGFIIIHGLGNSTIFLGRVTFLAYAEHLHKLGPFLILMQVLLATLFALHIITGLSLFFQNRKARPIPYIIPNQAQTGFASRSMPYSGLTILLFIFVHIYTLHSGEANTNIADIVADTLSSPIYALLYLAGITALSLHLLHGLYSIFQSIGLTLAHRNHYIKNIIRVTGLWPMVVFFVIITITMITSGNILK